MSLHEVASSVVERASRAVAQSALILWRCPRDPSLRLKNGRVRDDVATMSMAEIQAGPLPGRALRLPEWRLLAPWRRRPLFSRRSFCLASPTRLSGGAAKQKKAR